MKIFSAQLKGTTIVVSGSSASITGSFTGSIAGIDINATNTFTASTIARLSSIETISSSNDSRVNSLEAFSSSIFTTNTFTSSTSARLNSIETISASNLSRLTSLESTSASVDTLNTTQNTRLTSLEIKTGSLATTGSNFFSGSQTITGSLYISADLIVQGSSSLQNITASAVSIGTNIINLNTANPAIRYAGLSIGDSGSIGSSGSFLYDSVQDEMIFIHRGANSTVTSSVTLMGPQTYDNIGSEIYPTSNRIQKGTGNEHLVDSCIFDNGTTICFNTPTGSFSGRLSIGITNPTTALHVSGTIATGEASTGWGRLSFDGSTNNVRLQASKDGTDSIGLSFWTQASGGGFAERMIISGSNVGINCSTPSYNLDVNGTARILSTIITNDSLLIGTTSTATGARIYACNNAAVIFRAESTEDQAGLRLIAGCTSLNRASRIDFLNGATSRTTPQWTIINDYNQDGTNDLSIVNCNPAIRPFKMFQSGIACFSCQICVANNIIVTGEGIFINRPTASTGEPYIFWQKNGTNRGAIYGADNASGLRYFGASNCFEGVVCAPQFTGGFVCAVGGLNVRGASTTWSSLNIFPDNPGGAGAQCNTVLAGSFVGCTGWGPQLRFSGACGGFIDIGQDSTAGFVIETSDTPRLRVHQCGAVQISCVAYKSYILSDTTIQTPVPILQLDRNSMYEIEYSSMHYGNGLSTNGWRYVRWHGYDGSGNAGQGGGCNFFMQVIESTGTAEASATPSLFGCVQDGRMYICYGNGYASYRQLNVRRLIDDGSTNSAFL
jgi:hypothetical protein